MGSSGYLDDKNTRHNASRQITYTVQLTFCDLSGLQKWKFLFTLDIGVLQTGEGLAVTGIHNTLCIYIIIIAKKYEVVNRDGLFETK